MLLSVTVTTTAAAAVSVSAANVCKAGTRNCSWLIFKFLLKREKKNFFLNFFFQLANVE